MGVRRASVDDIGDIIRIGRAFYESSVWADVLPYDPDHFAEWATAIMQGEGVIFLSENGMIGGALAPVYFSKTARIAAEMFWYSVDGHGADLLSAFEAWAEDAGADIIQMTGQANERERGIRRLYAGRGYTAREIGFFKVL